MTSASSSASDVFNNFANTAVPPEDVIQLTEMQAEM